MHTVFKKRTLVGALLGAIAVFAVLAAPALFAAAEDPTVEFTPQITIPGSPFIAGTPVPIEGTSIGEWVSAVYTFLAGAMGVIAAVMVMWGGIKWLTASGNTSNIQDAKDTIYSAIIALLLTFGSYLLLYTINPRLVEIRDLTDLVASIARIEQVADLPRRVSSVLFGNAPLTQQKNAFNAQACPTLDEMRSGFDVFLTGYYRPAFPDIADIWKPSGGYSSFPCNVGMQCSCARDKTRRNQCSGGGLTWTPCDMAKFDRDNYCNKTASGSAPVEFGAAEPPYTAAASNCFGFGTVFTLSRSGAPASLNKFFSSEWAVQDLGSDIRGRHLDLFTGTGPEAQTRAVNITGSAVMRVTTFCDSRGDCDAVAPPESGSGGGGGF